VDEEGEAARGARNRLFPTVIEEIERRAGAQGRKKKQLRKNLSAFSGAAMRVISRLIRVSV